MNEILCRIDPATTKPVVFIANTYNRESSTVSGWVYGDKAPHPMSVEFYHTTLPLSEEDQKTLAERYKTATGDNDAILRQRLPRTPKSRPNLLAAAAAPQATAPLTMQPRPRKPRGQRNTVDAPIPVVGQGAQWDLQANLRAVEAEFQRKIAAIQRAAKELQQKA